MAGGLRRTWRVGHAALCALVVALLVPVAATAGSVGAGEILVTDRSTAPSAKGAAIHVNPATGFQVRHSVGDADPVGTGFTDPAGLVIAASGKLYVVDFTAGTGGTVFEVATAAHAEPPAGTPGGATQTALSTGGVFVDPTAIAVDGTGNLIVADRSTSPPGFPAGVGAVIRVNSTTGAQTILSPVPGMTTANFFVDPTGVVVAPNGDIFVTDRSSPSPGGVIRVNPVTGDQTVVTSGGSLSDPWSLVLHPDGNIYVADRASFGSGAVVRVDPATGAQSVVYSGPPLVDPEGIGVAANGDLLVADAAAFVARVTTGTPGALVTISSAGNFVDPSGVIATRSSTLSASVAGLALFVSSTADDAFSITCSGGNIRINGRDPDTGPAVCSSVSSISATGGPGANTIDLSSVGPGTFSAVTSVTVNGGGGDDLVRGGAFDESLSGAAGIDKVFGGDGADFIVVSDGSDTVDGQGGGDFVNIVFGLLAGAPVSVSDTGASGVDVLRVDGTAGPDTILASDFGISRGAESISVGSGFESRNILGLGDNDVLDAVGSAITPYALLGGPGTDTLNGGAAGDLLDGEDGNDTLSGGGGSDFLLAGAGDDTLDGGFGNDVYKVWTTAGAVGAADSGAGDKDYLKIYGSTGADTITVAPALATGGTMATTFSGIEGEIVVYGDGDDTGTGYGFGPGDADILDASTATKNVHLFGQKGDDTITGGPGNDGLNGGDGNDTMSGGGGNDMFDGGLGGDAFTGGAGSDTVAYVERTASVFVTADGVSANDGEAGEGDNVAADIEKLMGGSAADTLTGNALNNTLIGGGGDDTLNGGSGNDTLVTDAGGDTLNGNSGTADLVSYSGRTGPVVVTADGVSANDGEFGGTEGDNVGNDVEKIIGTNFDDSLTGGSGANVLTGLGGLDFLDGGSGNDTLDGGLGGDGLVGGLGIDTVSYATRASPVHVDSGNGAPDDGEFFGGEGDNVGSDIERIYGSLFGDVLAGGPFADTIYGGGGDDDITGGAGADVLYGQGGFDFLHGIDGYVDKLYCGTEFDTAERDVFPADIVSLDCEALSP